MAGWSGETIRETGNGERIMTRPNVGGLDPPTAALGRAAAALEDLVLVDAYGKVIGRPGLDMKRRELCTVAAVAVLGTAQQLHSHLRGALNTGATREEVEAVLGLIDGDLDPEHRRRVREQWQDVQERKL